MRDIWWWNRRQQWCAEVPDPKTGRRKRWYLGPSEQKARAEYHRRMAQQYGSMPDDSTPDSISLAALAARWLDWTEANRAQATLKSREAYLAWLLAEYGEGPAHLLRPADVEHIKATRRKTYAPRTINHFVTIAKGVFRWGQRQGLVADNPIEHVQGVPNSPVKKLAVSDEVLKKAIKIGDTKPPIGDFLRVLVNTGMRCGELAGLPWTAYDPQERVLCVAAHKTVGRTGNPKYVPVNAVARAAIERQELGTEAIFSHEDARALPLGTLKVRWQRLRKKHKGAKPNILGVTFHSLRHTFISRVLAAGMPELHVRWVVGHSSVLMTRYYAKADLDAMRRVVDGLDGGPIPRG